MVVVFVAACGGDPLVAADTTSETVAADTGAAPDDAPEPPEETEVTDVETSAPATLDARDYCEATVELFCPYYLRCGRMAVDTLEACRATFLESCNARYEPIYAALAERGALSLSRAGIERCRAHLEAVSCEAQIFDLDGGCDAVWVGEVGLDGACAPGIESFVCEAGTTCLIGLDFCGRCVPLAAPGEACDLERRCPEDGLCVEGACVARAAVGEGCDAERRCRLGADCVEGTCRAPAIVALGERCDQAHRCPYRAACVGGVCRQMALLGEPCGQAGCASGSCQGGVCVALSDPGAACERHDACRSGRCEEGGRCASLINACLE